MLKNKNFWMGFAAGYLLIVFVPQANVLGMVSGMTGGGGRKGGQQ